MTTPFEPIGDTARWRVLYHELLKSTSHGDLITYDAMGNMLDLDPEADRHAIQMAVRRAARELLEADKLALDAVPNQGYRVVQASEHMELARRQQRRSHRALSRGHKTVVNVDFSGMEPEVRKAFDVMASAFAMQMDFNRRIDVRQRNLESATKAVTARQDRTEEELAELRERLDRIVHVRREAGS